MICFQKKSKCDKHKLNGRQKQAVCSPSKSKEKYVYGNVSFSDGVKNFNMVISAVT
jgi:hypothetical protein